MKGVLVMIAGNDLACARAWAAEIERRVRGANPSGFSTDDRYLTSFLGQIAWLRWCRLYGLRCRYTVETEGRSHHGQFALFGADHPKECIIKTASVSWHEKLMLPVKQEVDDTALYVGMRVCSDPETILGAVDEIEVECCGVIDGTEVMALPVEMVKVPTRFCLLKDLGSLAPVRNGYDQGDLELRGRALELEPTSA